MTVVGIDLGTSNSALAYTGEDGKIASMPIAQLENPGMVARHLSLPSTLYLPVDGEVTSDACRLPWQEGGETKSAVGRWARSRSAEAPDRVLTSAKSWLCHRSVDRRSACLPWASDVEDKLSPVDASAKYLAHMWQAYRHELVSSPEHIVLTVPASFDEVARTLTQEAATQAGLPVERMTLLEEPQAALYSWIDTHSDSWREQIAAGDLILVCDVGGGTTDFSLIAVNDQNGEVAFERIAVGEHLLLGGDNMDLTLAYFLQQQLEDQGHQLDQWQFRSLIASARDAKERLLTDGELATIPISVASRGASLFAQTLTTELSRETVRSLIVEGFFPITASGEDPQVGGTAGIQEFGLQYAADPAVSRHLAAFLKRSAQNVTSDEALRTRLAERLHGESIQPTKILFNGGVFGAAILRERVLELIKSWQPEQAVAQLGGGELDLACSRGAAYYGRLKASGEGLRIRAGTSRSYYVGVEASMPAVPGIKPPVHGICIVPQGTEEGTTIDLPAQKFGLIVGQPVQFRFFNSHVRAGDAIGTRVDRADRELTESERLEVTLAADEGGQGEMIPVKMTATVTEMGVLELAMRHVADDRKWKLEFDVRGQES